MFVYLNLCSTIAAVQQFNSMSIDGSGLDSASIAESGALFQVGSAGSI
jgi:hypothetical protein